jgi:hypothetical protein
VVAALVGALLVDVHVELKRAWGCLIESGLPAGACREFGNPGVTESEAAALAAGPWRDPGTRNRMTQQWQQWAQRKYRGLVESPGAASQKGVSKP